MLSCSTGWPWTCCAVEDGIEFLIPLPIPLPTDCWGDRHAPWHMFLRTANRVLGFMHARHALRQLSHTPSSFSVFENHIIFLFLWQFHEYIPCFLIIFLPPSPHSFLLSHFCWLSFSIWLVYVRWASPQPQHCWWAMPCLALHLFIGKEYLLNVLCCVFPF